MLTIRARGTRLCDNVSRREMLRAGGLGLFGLSCPELLRGRAAAAQTPLAAAPDRSGGAKSCIVLFLMGGPPQHSTWDPKPDAPDNIRGDFKPITTSVPGVHFCELMPRLAGMADKLCVLRGVCTNDNAHSSSGYYMMTGEPHQPLNVENANPGPPNNWPTLGAVVARLKDRPGSVGAVRLPHRIFNTDGSVWPGQDAGFLGRNADPWLLRCEPGSPQFRVPEFSLGADVPSSRLQDRQTLLERINQPLDAALRGGALRHYDHQTRQAFDLLGSSRSRNAFNLDHESTQVRDRYGRGQFGQSVLLARRLVEAGLSLVQVNWFRGANEPSDNPCWDSHTDESARLRNVLVPPMDQAFSALLDDLAQRGLLDETLVVCLGEFGRTPRLNARGGRDHWGHVFSVALAGGGIRGGQVYGASDKLGGYPKEGQVLPQDLTATIFHCLGYPASTEIRDALGRSLAISRGRVIRAAL
jgi:hypothetical protein